MTVSTEVDHNDYTGNGVTTSFPYTFRIFKKSDLVVQVVDLNENITELILDTDYTVTGAGGYTGGNVILSTALANGYQISISRELPVTQETDLRNQGKFFAEVHEDAFDKLTMLIQQVRSLFSLALRKPSFVANYYDALGNYIRNLRDPSRPQDAATKNYVDSVADTNFGRTLRTPEPISSLPGIEQRKNKIVAMDNSGNPIMVLPESGSAADVLIELAKPTGAGQIGTSSGENVQQVINRLDNQYDDLDNRLNTSNSAYMYKNIRLLSDANNILRTGGELKIVCVGDSITIGHDTVSSDAIPGPNGNPFTVAPVQYPSRLQDRLNALTNATVTVLNHGFSGDTAKVSYGRWTTNPACNVAHIMFGINDAAGVAGATISEYIEYMEKTIRRYIEWGCGVVVHTSTPNNYGNNDGGSLFTQYARNIAQVYGCPIFESEGVIQYCKFGSVYSDGLHFNKAGYAKYGDAVASFVLASGWVRPVRNIAAYTAIQPGRATEGIGWYGKNATTATDYTGSYNWNGQVGNISPGVEGKHSFSFYLDCEAAYVYIVGYLAGAVVSCSDPETTVDGYSATNTIQPKFLTDAISETSQYTAPERNSLGKKSWVGSLVGRGWKTVYVRNDSDHDVNVNYLIIEPVSPDDVSQTNNAANPGKKEIYIFKSPVTGRTNPSSTIPAAAVMPATVTFPLPKGLFRQSQLWAHYYDALTLDITVKTAGASNDALNGVTKSICYLRGDGTFVIDSVFKSFSGCLVPGSINVFWENPNTGDAGTGWPTIDYAQMFINVAFPTNTPAYYTMEIECSSVMDSYGAWLD